MKFIERSLVPLLLPFIGRHDPRPWKVLVELRFQVLELILNAAASIMFLLWRGRLLDAFGVRAPLPRMVFRFVPRVFL